MKTMKLYSMLLIALLVLGAVACEGDYNNRNNRNDNDKEDRDYRNDRDDRVSAGTEANELIAGDDSKTWRMKKEFTSTGDREKVAESDKEEEINFHRNNTFSIVGERATSTGTWSYDGSTLSLQYKGENASETFTVEELTGNRMRIRAVDGTEYVLVDKEF